jgi:hypothetical protein
MSEENRNMIEKIAFYLICAAILYFLIGEIASCDRRSKEQDKRYLDAGYEYVPSSSWRKIR